MLFLSNLFINSLCIFIENYCIAFSLNIAASSKKKKIRGCFIEKQYHEDFSY